MVIWLIGLSASGKTTIGREIVREWRKKSANTVLVDGDDIRRVFGQDRSASDYTVEGRRQNAERISKLCAWLDSQDVNVVCCILSIFHDLQAWNRSNLSRYFEVYIDVPVEKAAERDTKNLYGRARLGQTPNVVGVDIPFALPPHPDMVIDNRADGLDARKTALEILSRSGAPGIPSR